MSIPRRAPAATTSPAPPRHTHAPLHGRCPQLARDRRRGRCPPAGHDDGSDR
ncbi:hypothetical protein ACFPRL_29965 [Pseudoclavibacter helvolus]